MAPSLLPSRASAPVLNANQVAAYHRDGYVAVPQFFSADDVALMRIELARLVAEGKGRNVVVESDGKTRPSTAVNFQICPIHTISEVIRSLSFSAKVVSAVTALLGPNVRRRLDQVFIKPGKVGVGTTWHQDNDYFYELRGKDAPRGLGMWIAIHDATVANGTMHVIPGVHEQSFKHVREELSDHHVTCKAVVDESKAVAIEVPAGGVLLFNYGVPHCTKANTTDQERAGLALHFQDSAIPVEVKHSHAVPIIAGDGNDGGLTAYGVDQRGRWEAYVAAQQHAVSR